MKNAINKGALFLSLTFVVKKINKEKKLTRICKKEKLKSLKLRLCTCQIKLC